MASNNNNNNNNNYHHYYYYYYNYYYYYFISVKGIAAPNVLFVSGKLNFANDSVLFSA